MDFTYTHRVRAILFKQMNNIASQWCIKRHRTGNHVEFCLFVCLFVCLFLQTYTFSLVKMQCLQYSSHFLHSHQTYALCEKGIKKNPNAFIMPIPPLSENPESITRVVVRKGHAMSCMQLINTRRVG